MKAANSLVSNKILDGHTYIATPLSHESAMGYSSQFSVTESSNATTGTGENSHGLCTCLCCYGSGALTGVGSIIGYIVPELLTGQFRYYTLTLMLASLSLTWLLLLGVPSNRYFPIALQYTVETDLSLRWFMFGFISAQTFAVATKYLDKGEWVTMGLFMLNLVLQGLLLVLVLWHFSRDCAENVKDTDTMELDKGKWVTMGLLILNLILQGLLLILVLWHSRRDTVEDAEGTDTMEDNKTSASHIFR